MNKHVKERQPETGSGEACVFCRFCMGPILYFCGNPHSEFSNSPVDALGWCDLFEREQQSRE